MIEYYQILIFKSNCFIECCMVKVDTTKLIILLNEQPFVMSWILPTCE